MNIMILLITLPLIRQKEIPISPIIIMEVITIIQIDSTDSTTLITVGMIHFGTTDGTPGETPDGMLGETRVGTLGETPGGM
jgi:hypothetical protein